MVFRRTLPAGDERLVLRQVYTTIAGAQEHNGAYWDPQRGWYEGYKWLSDRGLAPITA